MRLLTKRSIWSARVLTTAALLVQSACGGTERPRAVTPRNGVTGESTGTTALGATPLRGSGASPSTDGGAPKRRVVMFGTSLTAGLGLNAEQAYPALLQRKVDSAGLSFAIVNAGLSGETSAGARRRAAWVLEQPAALVVLEVGANDGLQGVNPDSTLANIVALVGAVRAQRPDARVLLVQMEAPTNLGRDYTRRFHALYGTAARTTNTTLLPFLLEGVAGVSRLNQSDGIHPNAAGSQLVATTVFGALVPVLRELQGSR